MLYKIREKWQHRYFAVLVVLALGLLTCVLLAVMMSLCNGSSGVYDDAYYFLIKGVYIPFFSLALLDIVISFVKRMLQEREYKSVINEMNELLIVAAISIIVIFQSPITFGRFVLVVCDIPNMIMGSTRTVRTDEFKIQSIDEKKETRSNTFHEYHYYVMIDGQKYIVSKFLETEDFNRMADDYADDEMNGRPKMLNKGLYEVEYLPVSRCIINVNFYDIWYK